MASVQDSFVIDRSALNLAIHCIVWTVKQELWMMVGSSELQSVRLISSQDEVAHKMLLNPP